MTGGHRWPTHAARGGKLVGSLSSSSGIRRSQPALAFVIIPIVRPAKNVAVLHQQSAARASDGSSKGAVKWTQLSSRSFAANAAPNLTRLRTILASIFSDFCEHVFRRERVFDRSSLTLWRQRLGGERL